MPHAGPPSGWEVPVSAPAAAHRGAVSCPQRLHLWPEPNSKEGTRVWPQGAARGRVLQGGSPGGGVEPGTGGGVPRLLGEAGAAALQSAAEPRGATPATVLGVGVWGVGTGEAATGGHSLMPLAGEHAAGRAAPCPVVQAAIALCRAPSPGVRGPRGPLEEEACPASEGAVGEGMRAGRFRGLSLGPGPEDGPWWAAGHVAGRGCTAGCCPFQGQLSGQQARCLAEQGEAGNRGSQG